MTTPLDDLGELCDQPRGMVGDTHGLFGVRHAIRYVLTRMFGRPPFDSHTDAGDEGLMGPDAASWRVIAEPAAIAGGIRGLFMQTAHPLAMAGVNDHSAYQQDPLDRLHRTSQYVTTTTYGSVRQALEAVLKVRQVHQWVNGTAPDGRPYDANDPRLLTWVSIALTDSFLDADRRWSPAPLPPPEADRFVAEQSYVAALLDPRVDVEALLQDATRWAALRRRELDLPMIVDGTLPTTADALRQCVE
ncbi:MAG: oxygenase MpaB family protein, partial [Nitriliruptoraceae bacterium]